jgi:hypothetical protein
MDAKIRKGACRGLVMSDLIILHPPSCVDEDDVEIIFFG